MKIPYILLISALLTGCSALDVAQSVATVAAGDKPALSVDAQIGDKTMNVGENDNSMTQIEDNKGILTMTSNKADKSFGNTKSMTINEGPNLMWSLLFVLGWLMPSHTEIYREIKSWFTRKG